MMASSRQEYVVTFWKESCSPSPTTSLRSAIAGGLLSCLAFDDILELIVTERAHDGRLQQKALGRVADAFDELPAVDRSKAARRLLQLAKVTPYPRRSTIEYLLEVLYRHAPPVSRRVILKTFLESRKRGQRKRAYRMMRADQGAGGKPMLAKAWRTWRDIDAALLIVEQFDSAFLVEHVKDLPSDLDGSAGMSRLFLRVASERPSALCQLKKLDGITYSYVCARLSKGIPTRAATKLIEKYKNDPRLGILAWSLGKLGNWSLLVELSKKVQEIENDQTQEDYARMGFSSEAIRTRIVEYPNEA